MKTPISVPLIDLRAQHQALREEILAAVAGVVDSTQFILGEQVQEFEREFAGHHGPEFEAVGLNSGTSALHLALLALGIGPGDEVITTPYSFLATAEAIRYTGARPVFVDIDPARHTLDSARLEAAITPRTRAVVPVHIFGQPADITPLMEIARRRGLALVEDAAQAHFAEYQGRKAGTFGDIGCFSFYPSKNLGACGEGGLTITRNPDLAARMRMLRDWGQREKAHHEIAGFNLRMDGIQAAILRVKLERLADWTTLRRRHAAAYRQLIQTQPGLSLPTEFEGERHAYHLFPIRIANRAAAQSALKTAGIGTGVHYPTPIHLLPPWKHLGHRAGDFPEAEALAREELSLPMYPELTSTQIRHVAESLNAFAAIRG